MFNAKERTELKTLTLKKIAQHYPLGGKFQGNTAIP
jgi:hypothetical protein